MKTRTAGEVITAALVTLNDAAGTRYKQAASLSFIADALNYMRNDRPDLFLGLFSTGIGTITTASVLPVDDQFFRPVVDYVIARHETSDAEHVESARVALMAGLTAGFLK